MEVKFQNAFESVILFNTNKEIVSKKEEFDISFNRNIGFIEDYFNFTNNDISIHILKKKFEESSFIMSLDIDEINKLVNKIVDNFEKLDLKKFTMPVTIETIAKSIEDNIYIQKETVENASKINKVIKRKNLYLLLLILFNKDKIKTKLLEDYKILLLLNKVKIPANIETFMKKENFYENYYNPFAKLLSDFYVKNELIAFYVKLINIYFTKTVIKESNISVIDNYSVTPKVFVEKSLVKLTGMIAKKVSSYIAPCIKNIISINPLGVTISIAGSYLISLCIGKMEKKLEKQSDKIEKNDLYKISLLEDSLLELIKSIIFCKISKSKENKERYKEKITKTKEYLTKFGQIEDLDKCIENNDSFTNDKDITSSIEKSKLTLEDCFKKENN